MAFGSNPEEVQLKSSIRYFGCPVPFPLVSYPTRHVLKNIWASPFPHCNQLPCHNTFTPDHAQRPIQVLVTTMCDQRHLTPSSLITTGTNHPIFIRLDCYLSQAVSRLGYEVAQRAHGTPQALP